MVAQTPPQSAPGSASAKAPDAKALEVVARMVAEQYSGPFPHPDLLERYEALVPGCAQQLFDDAHAQTEHRMELERIAIRGDDFRATLGVFVGATIGIGGLVLAGYFAYKGQPLTGLGTVILDLGTLAGVFVYGSQLRKSERQEKAEAVATAPVHRRGRGRLDAGVRRGASHRESSASEQRELPEGGDETA